MTIDTSTKNVKAITFGVRQINREWIAGHAADLLDALAAERDRAEHITKVTQRSRRFSSEQWAQAAREALDGNPGNLRNRADIHNSPSPSFSADPVDGSPLLSMDGERLQSIDSDLAALRAENEVLRKALQPFAEIADDWAEFACPNCTIDAGFTPAHLRAARAALSTSIIHTPTRISGDRKTIA